MTQAAGDGVLDGSQYTGEVAAWHIEVIGFRLYKSAATIANCPSFPYFRELSHHISALFGSPVGGLAAGADVVVGAGSVVTRDVPDGVVVFGSPAKIAGKVEDRYWTI